MLDHLIVIAPDRDLGVDFVAERTGVRAEVGGQHPAFGTCNALMSLGNGVYLEIMAPDPSLPPPGRPRLFGMDELAAPELATWVARSDDLEDVRSRAVQAGVPLGPIEAGGRRRPDGSEVRWRVTDPYAFPADGLVPFLIDWGSTPHPSIAAVGGVRLAGLRGEHPDASRVATMLDAMGLDLPVTPGPAPRLIASLETPRGSVELG